tara:strand:- start:269 stop:463 length:195 start_codon:yes stop_codon:yes gene_type:complete
MDKLYIIVLVLVIIVACQTKQENVEDFTVLKKTIIHVKKTFQYGFFVISNTMGILKDFITFKWM